MRRLEIAGLAFLIIFAVGSLSTSAIAAEAGILPLKELAKGIEVKEGVGGEVAFKGSKSGKTIKCSMVENEKTLLGGKAGEGLHIVLGTGTVRFKGCKQESVSCLSELEGKKAAEGEIKLAADYHFINVLTVGNELEPGLAVKTLVRVVCPPLIIELSGTLKGLILDETGKLTKDTTLVLLDFVNAGEKCDTSDTLCAALDAEKEKLLVNFGKGFEQCAVEGKLHLTVSEELMFLVDD